MKRFSLLSIEGKEKTKELMNVALGNEFADLAIINGTVFNTYTGEFLEGCAVAVKGDWIAYVGDDPGNRIGKSTKVIDAGGRVLIPGFIDGHTHPADMLYRPSDFVRHVAAGGTTTVITETLETYPILGYEGIDAFMASLKDQPIKFFATVPPLASTSSIANVILKKDLKRLLKRDDVLGLGESYWSAIMQDLDSFLPIFRESLLSGKKIEGHTAGSKGEKLMAYLAPGISSCHEPITAEEVLERLRLGIHVMIREGSIRRDLEAISKIRGMNVDLRRLILVTDGVAPEDLLKIGYLESVVQKAIHCGFEPKEAIQMATLNVAEYFQLDGFIGGIAPGKHADILIIPDPRTISADIVISRGKVIAENGKLTVSPRNHDFSDASRNSVHLPRELDASDFTIQAVPADSDVKVRVIDLVTPLVTKELITSVPVVDGLIHSDTERDILKLAAIDRAKTPGKMFVGLIRGFNLRAGALACSSAWDTSDIIVVGADDKDMAGAVNRVHELQGGAVVCSEGNILAELPMPVLGLLSDLPLKTLVQRLGMLTSALKKLGCPFDDPHHTLVTLTGAAIPFIRICEEGLVDIKSGKKMGLFIS